MEKTNGKALQCEKCGAPLEDWHQCDYCGVRYVDDLARQHRASSGLVATYALNSYQTYGTANTVYQQWDGAYG